MTPNFYGINTAIYYTQEYYKIGRIAAHIGKWAGEPNSGYLDSYLDNVYFMHKSMENEIKQGIHIFTDYGKFELFEFLKTWQTDWKLGGVNITHIQDLVKEYNDKEEIRYNELVAQKEVEFLNKGTRNKVHLKEYEYERLSFGGLLGAGIGSGQIRKYKEINYHFYANTEKHEFIDADYLPQYYKLLEDILNNFQGILNKYITLYDNGLVLTNRQIGTIKAQLQIDNGSEKKIEEPTVVNPKVKVNVSAGKLVALIKLLHQLDPSFFDVKNNVELQTFIRNNFITPRTKADTMSEKKIANLFSSPSAKDIKHWIPILRKMVEDASKF